MFVGGTMKKFISISSIIIIFSFNCAALNIGNVQPVQRPTTPSQITHVDHLSMPVKDYSLCIVLEADNDLFPFAGRSLRQLQVEGSGEHINILVLLDIHLKGQNKVTKKLYVERNRLVQIGEDMQVDIGDPQVLVDFFKWSKENFPAKHYCLDFWNHGTGFIDPTIPRTINPSELFYFNTTTKLIELDRRVGFIDFVTSMVQNNEYNNNLQTRGICFAETTGTYLTNQKMCVALDEITRLLGRKIDIIFFDACLMQMWEIFRIIAPYADYSVGSQEVELGPGYNYTYVLEPFRHRSPTPHEFACHAVNSYEKAYSKITHDYTQSAVALNGIGELDSNINELANLLIESLHKQKNGSVKEVVRACRNKRFCTQFDEPSYIDAQRFFENLLRNVEHIILKSQQDTGNMRKKLRIVLKRTIKSIGKIVIANKAGSNLPCHGISIYFPERRIHPSCYNVPGYETNKWLKFIVAYLGI